jgi:hypothetical protein
MNILEQAKDEEFIKEQFVKGRILDDTKDYGRTQFVDEIYTLQQENQQLKDNWDIIKQEILKIRQSTFSKYNSNEWNNCLSFNDDIEPILNKMKELEGSDSNG